MSRCEVLPLIQQGLNSILDNSDLDRIIELYKLSILIKNNHNEDFVKLFAIKYIDYYVGRLEFINGIKNMSENYIGEIKMIMINYLDSTYGKMKDKESYVEKYYQRRNKFIELPIEEVRNLIIEEHLSGIHSNQANIEKLMSIKSSLDYSEEKRLEDIDIDFEISKVKGKLINKYTEEGNYEEDESVLNIIVDNINKKGYTSHHLHIYVYEALDKAINKIFREDSNNHQKVY